MFAREIFEVYAKVVDANGTYNTLSGYPKAFDSKNYDNDIEKARKRAEGEYHECIGAMCKNDTRQIQTAYLLRCSDGLLIAKECIGQLAMLPDPNTEA